jgi:PIN domain nuclease of toxin-antitoxin system
MKYWRIVVVKLKSKAQYLLDASALMALINNEPGAAVVEKHIDKACISSINFTEVLSKMLEQGIPITDASRILNNFGLEIVPFTADQIEGASLLRVDTKKYGLSLADRVCLNLGKILKLPILTTDQIWVKIKSADLTIILARQKS